MKLEKILRIIQTQRHDFLNHLQVISGLLQLNKTDRALEYIKQVNMEIAQFSKTAKVNIPEVTVVLLAGLHDASMFQIEFELAVKTDLAECAVPSPAVGEALESSLNLAISTMASPEAGNRHIEVVLEEAAKDYTCRITFPSPPRPGACQLESELVLIGDLLKPHGGQVNLAGASKSSIIFLTFPRKEPKNG